MVYRIYVEKKEGFDNEARALLSDVRELLDIGGVEKIRILNRYDAEDIDLQLFKECVKTVFSEPQMDLASEGVDLMGARVFAVEYLPGQFDQRADSAAQCVQLVSLQRRPVIRTAKVYAIYGGVSESDLEAIKKYVINPVESREASLAIPPTLKIEHPVPSEVPTLTGFLSLDEAGLADFVKKYALAMDEDDIAFCQAYFQREGRDPTLTEIRMIDTYWSDHCRHTTFLTTIDDVTFEDELLESAYKDYLAARSELSRTKPVNLMDIGTIACKLLKSRGMLPKLDESEEINACTVKITVNVDGEPQDWLLLFKNETHNHPTEIEPFGGAATCIGGAIRDPLSGRSYVYAAMRVTGAGDPLVPVRDTLRGKLPQRKIVTTAAAGYSSYGNQIGLATGQVDELYHPGYVAKRLEIGAVIAATPAENVRREVPAPGDKVILLGGRTGRDGCGGATGSSKSHTLESLTHCGAEVQKGNAPEERKLQRLFRNKDAMLLIKRCNDFGAGGVSVAIGELADGLDIDLNAVPKKYDGLDGTELAISESQERMAVVVEENKVADFIALAEQENLEATVVATVTASPRLVMRWIPQLQRRGKAYHRRARSKQGLRAHGHGRLCGQLQKACGRSECLLQARAFRALRFDDRRGHRLNALRRAVSAHAAAGNGAPRLRRTWPHGHRLLHGVGRQSLYHRKEPLPRRIPRRRGERLQARRDGRVAGRYLSHLPGIFLKARARSQALGAAFGGASGRFQGADRARHRGDRRQGLHERHVRTHRRSAHARLLCGDDGKIGRGRLARIQGRGA